MPFVKKGNVGENIIPMENVPSQDFSLLSTTFEYILYMVCILLKIRCISYGLCFGKIKFLEYHRK